MAEVTHTSSLKPKEIPKILCVDDRPQNLVALDRVLAGYDVELIKATSGNEALRYVLKYDFALALLDVQMPEMDGYELAEIIRGDPDTENLPIIFISAIFTDRINVFKGYERGAFAFITKPFDPIELQIKVKFFVDKYLTEKAYEQSKNQIIQLYDGSPEMLFSIDAQSGLIGQYNKRLRDITKYADHEIIDQSVFKFFEGSDYYERAKDIFNDFLRTGEIDNQELKIFAKDGSSIDILWKSSAIRDTEGNIVVANTIWTDITEKNSMQAKLKDSYQKLEIRNEELENFVYLTSHQLQEPSQLILSFMKMLKAEAGDKIDEDCHNYINFSVEAAERMRSQVLQMLAYLRLGAKMESSNVSLDLVLESAVDRLEETIAETKAQINADNLGDVLGNEEYLVELFYHLIDNAIKYRSPDKLPVINIAVEKVGDKTQISFSDNGLGIKEQDLTKVFRIFQQLHARDAYSGLGVGLAIVKKIVELHNGKVEVKSKGESLGSTFVVTF